MWKKHFEFSENVFCGRENRWKKKRGFRQKSVRERGGWGGMRENNIIDDEKMNKSNFVRVYFFLYTPPPNACIPSALVVAIVVV